ncbi:MAG: ferric reductase-like transmembrane domain-containing protein [Anaerolineae bacterium]|nr:ferric reductase-like transmembrane domain-containing protein [Anaerolineae bacterium]
MTDLNRWIDRIVILFSFVMLGVSAWGMSASGVFDFALYQDEKLIWHLVRSSGILAYVLLMASTVWGLFLSSQIVKEWSPGPISMTLHSTISWLALLLGLGHGLLLMFDDYFTYTLSTIFVPFTGPYRPEVVGLGTLAFWLLLIVTLSFPFRKRMGHKSWKRLHYVSYVAFGLVTIHGLFAGTDGEHPGFRLLIGISLILVVLLLGIRLGKGQKVGQRPTRRETTREAG